MKITSKGNLSENLPAILHSKSPDSDLQRRKKNDRKQHNRKIRNPSFIGGKIRLKKDLVSFGKRSGPVTPLLSWKFDDRENGVVSEDKVPESSKKCHRKVKSNEEGSVSARKLAAALRQFQLPEVHGGRGERRVQPKKSSSHLGIEPGAGHFDLPFLHHRGSRDLGTEKKDVLQNPLTFCVPRNGVLYKVDPSLSIRNSAMERATKWDPGYSKTSDEVYRFYGQMKLLEEQQMANVSVVSALQAELEQARTRIDELENERRSSKKKLEHFLRKLADEKTLWRKREHEKARAVIDDIKADLIREKKNRQRMEMVNSKLINELTEIKHSAKRYMQDYEKEKKDRELMEEVCDELAKEIEEDKAEVETLKMESMKMREEVDEERKMLQMVEVWREERVQMKLVDAKLTLEEKYSQLSILISQLDSFLRSRSETLDMMGMREAEFLKDEAGKVNIQDIKFSYEPPKSDDIFSVFEELQNGETIEKEIEQCVDYSLGDASHIRTTSPENNVYSRDTILRHPNGCADENGEGDEDESGWETVSQADDQGSTYSQEISDHSSNRMRRESNVSCSGNEYEENAGRKTPDTEISELSSISARQSTKKKGSSIARIWRSIPTNGENIKTISVDGLDGGRLSNGRISNAGTISPDRGSAKGGLSPRSSIGQWSSPDTGYPHVTRGMKGCIEWPLGRERNSLKAKLLEARMECQKTQLRHVLKQKI